MSFFRKRKKQPEQLYHIPRTSLVWLLSAVVASILPHVGRMPFWLSLLCGLGVLGRILIYQGKVSSPGMVVKAVFVFVTLAAFTLEFGRNILTLNATVGMLIVGVSLKLLELQQKKDILLVIYLCYFTVIAEYIFSQAIPVAIYLGGCVVLITTALLSLHQTEEFQSPLRSIKLATLILLQSVPIMIALFILFPRISPMWSIEVPSNSAQTGLGSSMSPGDIGKLIGSSDVAFRVQFDADAPAQNQLYWRAITLDQFDGRGWRRSFNVEPQVLGDNPEVTRDWYNNIEYQGEIVDYNVIMEPTNQNWIYTLKIPQISNQDFMMRRDFQVDSIREITQRFSYDVRSYFDHTVGLNVESDNLSRMLGIPKNGNPRSREFALQLRDQSGSDEAYIQAVLAYFRQQQFYYTLSPGLLGRDSIDDFLFNTREGFCEHYSSTFTFLMRAAGVPARVVTGYQGGEFNPYDSTLTVRQFDAHAWSEVWLAGQGWVRVDPTAAVAPERVELGSQLSLQQESGFLSNAGFSMYSLRNSLFLNDLRFRLEMADYSWSRFVLNYNQEMQLRFFSRFFSNVTQQKIYLAIFGFLATATGITALLLLRKSKSRKHDKATLAYLGFCDFLGRLGLARLPGETPGDFCQRAAEKYPQLSSLVQNITQVYEDIAFNSSHVAKRQKLKTQELKRLIRELHILA